MPVAQHRPRKTAFAIATTLAILAILSFESHPTAAETPDIKLVGSPRQIASIEIPSVERLEVLMQTIGLREGGPPIRVEVVSRDSPAARRAPSWAVGYAVPAAGLVVVIPARAPSYPHFRIQQVLLHEIAHVLAARAAGRRPLPRWFGEGLAMVASREWHLSDRARTLVAGWTTDFDSLDHRFQEGPHSAASAYAISGSFVRYLIDIHGPETPAQILAHVGRGSSFESAFERTTGSSLASETRRFERHLDLWTRWIPILSSSAVLWMLITALALAAFVRRRQRDESQRRSWLEEELDLTIN